MVGGVLSGAVSVLAAEIGGLLLACSSGLRPVNGLFFGETSPGPSPGTSDGLIGVVVLGLTAGGGVATGGADAAGAAGLTAGGGGVATGGADDEAGGVVAPLNCPAAIPLSVSPLATV